MKKHLRESLITAIGACFLMLFAFYDNYPIVTADSGTYISSGFKLETPVDRPITYGLFLRFFSLGQSLWIPVFVQCFILSFLLIRFLKRWCAGITETQILAVILFLSLGTIAGWHASQLMPDIFTAMLCLSVLNYLFNSDSRTLNIIYPAVIFCSVIMHNSHLIIFTLLAGLLLLVWIWRGHRYFPIRRVVALVVMCPVAWLSFCAMNYAGGNGFTPSKSTHVFLMGKLVETGVLKVYLDKNCDLKGYKICAYRDSLPPAAWEFVWDSPSPLYKTGGWDANKEEYNAIIRHILSKPQYWVLLGFKSLEGTARQLLTTDIDGSYELPWVKYQEETAPYEAVKEFVPHEVNALKYSKQNTKTMSILFYDKVFAIVIILSSMFVLLIFNSESKREYGRLIFWLLMLIVINAFATATFANVLSRLNTRVVWMLPLLNIVIINNYLGRKWFFSGTGDKPEVR